MFPLRDENPSGGVPAATVAIIALNVVAFGYQVSIGEELREFVYRWGFVPLRLTLAREGNEPLTGPGVTMLSSMFLHGGFMHLAGNMWYLWIFGDNIESRLGRVRYILFYVLGGIAAVLIHYLTASGSRIPTIGASGAIAAVLGAYAVTFPRARVHTLIPLFPFVRVMTLPALLVLGLWFVIQFFSGALALAWSTGSGIAWWAHIGGFVFGMLAVGVMAAGRRPPGTPVDTTAV